MYSLRLAKADFKFSSAHFTVFAPGESELLHGHNYRVAVEVEGPQLDQLGFLVEISPVKRRVRALCEELDERVLVPGRCPHLEIAREGDEIEVGFGARRYRLPAQDVLVLPIANSTIEAFAELFWHRLVPSLEGLPLTALAVSVQETDGQGASYRAPLPG